MLWLDVSTDMLLGDNCGGIVWLLGDNCGGMLWLHGSSDMLLGDDMLMGGDSGGFLWLGGDGMFLGSGLIWVECV